MELPLTYNQERWLAAQELARQKGHSLPNPYFAVIFRIHNERARGVIEGALNAIVQRHEALRTRFEPNHLYLGAQRSIFLGCFKRPSFNVINLFTQSIDDTSHVAVREMGGMAGGSEDDVIRELVKMERGSAYESERIVPIRAALVGGGNSSSILIVTLSHLVADSWSTRLFRRELIELTESTARARKCQLPSVSLQAADFAVRERRAVEAGMFEKEATFWSKQWINAADALIAYRDLPFSRNSKEDQPVPHVENVELTQEESDAVRRSARSLQATPYVLFRTIVAAVIQQCTQKPHVAIWESFANRPSPETLRMISWCATRHIVITNYRRDHRLYDACTHMAAKVSEAQRYQALPLAALWRIIGRNLDTSSTHISCSYRPPLKYRESEYIEPLESREALVPMDLEFKMCDYGRKYAIRVTYDSNRYEGAGISEAVSAVVGALKKVAVTPTCAMSELIGRS
jgi:hypothetical protein